MIEHTAADIADHVGARLEGDGSRLIHGVAPLGDAGPADLTFLERKSLIGRLAGTAPGALIAREGVDLPETGGAVLRVTAPEVAFAAALPLFHPNTPGVPAVHPTALIGRGVALGEDVTIGPFVVIEDGARIGSRTEIGASVYVAGGAEIGDDCRLAHGVSVLSAARLGDRVIVHEGVRLGTEGFGFAATEEGALKIPQVGRCVIGDDVDIGANSTIDRGALGDTAIGDRTKLDNLVHVGHNVRIGSDCMVVAQVGIAGSSTVGDGASLAGQAGISGHCSIGAGARIAGQAGVIGDVPAGATYSGYPARPHRSALRASAAFFKLPEALARLARLERRMEDADGSSG
ncbi:MAG: UDP-3-O-(3-hydroxymyristoyl)glucosamine N-acyltransferase [Gemmatimonadota bacterium]|nr:UDP-3-O-(3-hydroxymyristoyl)glucosamine N-acyltransferase [Gemmatimonadota bacterium]